MAESFVFVPPPEAPVFRPTLEEFEDPLAYLMKIRHIGIKTGICKIIPPKTWNPPFAVNMEEFVFTPRIQRLYELEGGDKIRVPSIGNRYLDLHALHKCVKEAGGYQKICEDHMWTKIAEKLNYLPRYAHSIRLNYEKILLTFDQTVYNFTSPKKGSNGDRLSGSKRFRNATSQDEDMIDYTVNKELKNLQFFGAGPKAAVPLVERSSSIPTNNKTSYDFDEFSCRICNRGDDEANLLICDTETCQACYHLYCLNPPLRSVPKCQWKCPECIRSICLHPSESYGFPQSTKKYSLHEFGVMADAFKANYFKRPCTEVPLAETEKEFWRIVQEYNDDVVVEYGADIHSSSQGSGFPTHQRLQNLIGTAKQLEEAKKYVDSPWNLNVLPLLDKSVLRFIKGNIDGMKIPWCYVGMVFSSFCWHIEDHWSYSINFNHWGEPKTWYGVSRLHADDFERAMRKHAQELFDQSPDLLHHITTNMNPNLLQAEGVPIYRTDQHCGEFVVTFPRAYHAGFNQGFNFAEAVNICLPDWLPTGRDCIDHYAQMKRHCVFSNDELLCTLAELAVGRITPNEVLRSSNPNSIPGCSSAGLDISCVAIVHQEFTLLVKRERQLRQLIRCSKGVVNSVRILFNEMTDDSRVCDWCMTTLFLSGVSCTCSQASLDLNGRKRKMPDGDDELEGGEMDKADHDANKKSHMVCLKHVDSLCPSCLPNSFVLNYHYTLDELDDLEQSLAKCLTEFYSWRNRLVRLIETKSTDQSQSPTVGGGGVIVKQEAVGDDITLTQLEAQLEEGRAAGYHTDDIFDKAEVIANRGKHLVDICSRLHTGILSDCDSAETKLPAEIVRFEFKRPATFTIASSIVQASSGHKGTKVGASPSDNLSSPTNQGFVMLGHEFDVNNPRESDLVRLIESCEHHSTLNLMADRYVSRVKHLLDRIQSWRQIARDTVTSLCHLLLTNATRSMTVSLGKSAGIASSSSSTEASNYLELAALSHWPVDVQVWMLLHRLTNYLASDFPLFVRQLPDWLLFDLLRNSIKWLCIYLHFTEPNFLNLKTDTSMSSFPNSIRWSFYQLRKHLACGEDLIGQLTVTSNSANQKSQQLKTTFANQPISVDNGLTPIMRLLRARMHTSVGNLTQCGLQVETLIGSLVDVLNTGDHVDYADISHILEQLDDLNINHFVCKPNRSDSDSVESLLGISSDHVVDDASMEPSWPIDDVIRLSQLYECHLDRLLDDGGNRMKTTISSCNDRPNLIQNQVFEKLGSFIFIDLAKTTETRTSEVVTVSSDSFNSKYIQLRSLIKASKQAVQELTDKFACSVALSYLLPAFSLPSQTEEAIAKFEHAFNVGYGSAEEVYNELVRSSEQSVVNILEAFCNQVYEENEAKRICLCAKCLDHLKPMTCERSFDQIQRPTDVSTCSLCQLTSTWNNYQPKPSFEWLCQFASRWKHVTTTWSPTDVVDLTVDDGNSICLSHTPTSLALNYLVTRIHDWISKLHQLIQSELDAFDQIGSHLESDLSSQLPPHLVHSLRAASHNHQVDEALLLFKQANIQSNQTKKMAIAKELIQLSIIVQTMPFDSTSLVNFIQLLLTDNV